MEFLKTNFLLPTPMEKKSVKLELVLQKLTNQLVLLCLS